MSYGSHDRSLTYSDLGSTKREFPTSAGIIKHQGEDQETTLHVPPTDSRRNKLSTITMSDPVAEKSAFLRMYMSNHPDTLVAYAKWFGKVNEVITSAEMSAIDTKVRSFFWVPNFYPIIMFFLVILEYDLDLHNEGGFEKGRTRSHRPTVIRI